MAEGWQQPASLPWDPSQTLLREANEMPGGRAGDDLGAKRCMQCGASPARRGRYEETRLALEAGPFLIRSPCS